MGDMGIYSTGMAASWANYAGGQYTAPAVEGEEQAQPVQPTSEQEDKAKTLADMMREAKEKAEAQRERLKLPKNTSQYGDAAMMAYSRLARARTPAEASAAASYARRRIAQFQGALRQDSENAERIRAAISQLQKAASRAGKKRNELTREALVKARQKRAEKEKQHPKAMRLRQDLARRRTMRVIRESGYLRETEIDNRLQAQLAQTRMELRAQAQELAAAASVSLESAVQQYSAQSAAAEVPAAPAISVQA